MRKRKRIKRMPLEQFEEVRQRDWSPVKLEDDAIPSWLRGIPQDVLNSVYASGTASAGLPLSDSAIPAGLLIGGIDVYRNAPDDQYELNKDWYAVITMPDSDGMLLIEGPISDSEHWLDEIPERLKGAEVFAVPPKLNEAERGKHGRRAMMSAWPLGGPDRASGSEEVEPGQGAEDAVGGARRCSRNCSVSVRPAHVRRRQGA